MNPFLVWLAGVFPSSSDLMGCLHSTTASKEPIVEGQVYYDPTNNLISWDPLYRHNPSVEVNFVSSHDATVMKAGDECYIVSCTWLNLWLEYVKGKGGCPSGIDNKILVETSNGRKLKKNIIPKKDYRPVCKAVWEFYFVAYGGGPIILFHGKLRGSRFDMFVSNLCVCFSAHWSRRQII